MKKINLSIRKQRRLVLTIIVISVLFVTFTGFSKEVYVGGVDTELCTECGSCCSEDPNDIFQALDGRIIVLNPISDVDKFKAAQSACPTGALWCNF